MACLPFLINGHILFALLCSPYGIVVGRRYHGPYAHKVLVHKAQTAYYLVKHITDGRKYPMVYVPAHALQQHVIVQHVTHEVTHNLLLVVCTVIVIIIALVQLLGLVRSPGELIFAKNLYGEIAHHLVVLLVLGYLMHRLMSKHSIDWILCVKCDVYGSCLWVVQAILGHRFMPFYLQSKFRRKILHGSYLLPAQCSVLTVRVHPPCILRHPVDTRYLLTEQLLSLLSLAKHLSPVKDILCLLFCVHVLYRSNLNFCVRSFYRLHNLWPHIKYVLCILFFCA